MDIAAKNTSATPILKGQVVRRTGLVQPQQIPSIALASAAAASTATVLGLAVNNIAIGAIGQVRVSGDFTPIDTSAFTVNALVYLSNTPGDISVSPGTISSVIGYAIVIGVSGCISITCAPASNQCNSGGGSGATGIQGVTGAGSGGSGDTGVQGVTGISGGGTGLQGVTGIAGGGTGVQGVTGISGGGTGLQGVTGISGITGIAGLTGIQGETGLGAGTGASNTLNMNIQGDFSLIVPYYGGLPLVNVGAELCGGPVTYVIFRARREIPGTSGTTTIQLELNGAAIPGAILSWIFTDGSFTLQSVAISVAAVGGDRLSFRITSIEGGNPQNIFAEINA